MLQTIRRHTHSRPPILSTPLRNITNNTKSNSRPSLILSQIQLQQKGLSSNNSRPTPLPQQTIVRGFSCTSNVKSEQQQQVDSKPGSPSKDDSKQTTLTVLKEVVRLFKLAQPDRKMLLLALSLLFISCTINMMIPRAYGAVLDATKNIIDGELPSIAFDLSLYQFLGLVGAMLLVGISADYGRIILLRILGEKLVARLRSNVIKKTMSQDAEFFDVHKVGDLISRLGSDCFVVSRSMTQNISDGFKHTINGTVSILSMFYISTKLAGTVFIFLPGILIGTLIFGNKVRTISRQIQESTGNLTKVGEEQLSGIKTIQSFVAEGKELSKYNDAIRRVFGLGKREAKLNATFYSSIYFISDATFLTVLAYGAQLVASGSLSVGELAAFMLYVNHSGSAMFGIASFYSELMKGTGAASRLFELIDRIPLINPTLGLPLKEKPRGEIEFQNVKFSYPTRPNSVIFQNVSFKIPQGSNVCIVGPSGKGKSTITSLLLRYYDINQGKILLDGEDISKFNVKSLRRYLGVVQQEPILMSGTIRDNITLGLKSYHVSEDQIVEACQRANCHDFITKFPDGYDTVIGPRGALLSGGQKQRISIARALIKNPSVLILDEATSALDSQSEATVNETLRTLMGEEKLTTISIAHRMSTIKKADMVIVLGYDGRVAEIGKFDELYGNHNSSLYRLLNEEKHQLEDKPQKKTEEEEQVHELTAENIEAFNTQEFVKHELMKKTLEDFEQDEIQRAQLINQKNEQHATTTEASAASAATKEESKVF